MTSLHPILRQGAMVAALGLVGLVTACSDDTAETDPATGGMGGADGGEGGSGGLGVGYEEAVAAASWVKLAAAPAFTDGRKQDEIFFLDATPGFLASGPNEAIYATTDGGASWSPVFENSGTFPRALLFTDDQHGLAGNIGAGLSASITDANAIYRTEDGGANWTPVSAITGPAPAGICNFYAVDESHVFGVGRANGPSHLVASSDGGATWTSQDLGQWLMMGIDLRFTSETEGIVAGMSSGQTCTIVRTTDGGATFEPVFVSQTAGSLCWKLDFPTDEVGYVAVQDTTGGPATFGKTTDGGLTWTELPLPATGAYAAIGAGFITENIGWMVSADPSAPAYRTLDGGATWEVEPGLQGPINRFRFADPYTGYAAGGEIYKLVVDQDGA